MEATCSVCRTRGCAGGCGTCALGFCVETAAVRALSPSGFCCVCNTVLTDGSGFAIGGSAAGAVSLEAAGEVDCAGDSFGVTDFSGALAAAICALSASSL